MWKEHNLTFPFQREKREEEKSEEGGDDHVSPMTHPLSLNIPLYVFRLLRRLCWRRLLEPGHHLPGVHGGQWHSPVGGGPDGGPQYHNSGVSHIPPVYCPAFDTPHLPAVCCLCSSRIRNICCIHLLFKQYLEQYCYNLSVAFPTDILGFGCARGSQRCFKVSQGPVKASS